MNSSVVKYHKFPNVKSAELELTPKPAKQINLSHVLLAVVVVLLCAVLVVAVLAIGLGVGITQQQQQQETVVGLQNVVVTDYKLQGEYYGDEGGIQFESSVNDTHIHFKVSTIGGELVVVIIRPVETPMMMFEVNDTAFLTVKNEQGPNDEYVIPEAYTNDMESIMMGFEAMTNEMLDKMDNETVIEKSHNSLESLTMSPQASLIIEAALALGDTGLTGADSQAAMKFYIIALKLQNARDSVDPAQNMQSYSSKSESPRQKRSHLQNCRNNDATCRRGECPFRRGSNDCFGMCGKGCWCWSFVCGDCCIHNYCLTHDDCCANAGFFTFKCFRVAFDKPFSRCSDNFRC